MQIQLRAIVLISIRFAIQTFVVCHAFANFVARNFAAITEANSFFATIAEANSKRQLRAVGVARFHAYTCHFDNLRRAARRTSDSDSCESLVP